MSHGQKPRRPAFFPRMKHRGRKRSVFRATMYDADWNPTGWNVRGTTTFRGVDGSRWTISGGSGGWSGVHLA